MEATEDTMYKVMTMGELRERTKNVPDDTVLIVHTEDCAAWNELSPSIKMLPASLGAPAAMILDWGQEITEDHYIGPRFDVWLECGEYL